jgi:hypothetical protein
LNYKQIGLLYKQILYNIIKIYNDLPTYNFFLTIQTIWVLLRLHVFSLSVFPSCSASQVCANVCFTASLRCVWRSDGQGLRETCNIYYSTVSPLLRLINSYCLALRKLYHIHFLTLAKQSNFNFRFSLWLSNILSSLGGFSVLVSLHLLREKGHNLFWRPPMLSQHLINWVTNFNLKYIRIALGTEMFSNDAWNKSSRWRLRVHYYKILDW